MTPLRDVLQTATSSHVFAQTLAAEQITNHGLGYQADTIGILGPFQPLLVDCQMLKGVAQTQDIGISLAHVHIHLD